MQQLLHGINSASGLPYLFFTETISVVNNQLDTATWQNQKTHLGKVRNNTFVIRTLNKGFTGNT